MSQFVKAFRELSYAYSFIAECVSAAAEQQQQAWHDMTSSNSNNRNISV
jgi:hypothetical protein